MLKGDVGRPEIDGAGAAFVDPGGDRVKHVAAELPVKQIGRAADGKLAAIRGTAGGEDIVGTAVPSDRRVVGEGDIPFDRQGVRLLGGESGRAQGSAEQGSR